MSEVTLTDFARRKWGSARDKKLEFVQVYCIAGSTHSRISSVIEAFRTAAEGDQEHGDVAITYLLHCQADVEIANIRYKDTAGSLIFKTFAAWEAGDVGDRQILLLDINRRTTSSIDTLVMLDITQKLGARAEAEALHCLVVSVACDLNTVVERDGVHEVPVKAYELVGPYFPVVQYFEEKPLYELARFALEKLRQRQAEVEGTGADQLHSLGDDLRFGPTLVLLTRYCDAWELFFHLRKICNRVELSCITPWSSSRDIRSATSRCDMLKLVYIDEGVTQMPLISDAEVLIGPRRAVIIFDESMFRTVAVPDARQDIDGQLQAAFSLSSPPPNVYVFRSRDGSTFSGPSPALDSQYPHLRLCCVLNSADRHPMELPITFPANGALKSETGRRLGAWGLIGRAKGPAQKIRGPLATLDPRSFRSTPNINAAVLLGGVKTGVSNAAASVLVDMAVLVSHGPSLIFHLGTEDEKTRVMGHLEAMKDHLAQPLQELGHRGQLWLSAACIHAFRRVSFSQSMMEVMRLDVVTDAVTHANHIKGQLGIVEDPDLKELTAADVQAVEEQLAHAFLFNISLTRVPRDYFAVDFISGKVLYRHDDDGLDWEKLCRESDTPGLVAGVYTYLERSWDDDSEDVGHGLPINNPEAVVYRPRDVTIISLKAVAKALRETPSFERLRPSGKPRAINCVELDEVDGYFEGLEITNKTRVPIGQAIVEATGT
ncbi:hypothetical protein KVR01_004830 [Diaporthe batatas]|uniref:uncharacterized protein n=1 Tax=Diaporthe batatas TaxID=748121 RepID=UPI001D059A17|nr:uncharacterized protein KVR01_004830 [Diaporthe batatas]KAG8166278.1 hypothetical protein KVR01_004830 [Diaporthe batatas]